MIAQISHKKSHIRSQNALDIVYIRHTLRLCWIQQHDAKEKKRCWFTHSGHAMMHDMYPASQIADCRSLRGLVIYGQTKYKFSKRMAFQVPIIQELIRKEKPETVVQGSLLLSSFKCKRQQISFFHSLISAVSSSFFF